MPRTHGARRRTALCSLSRAACLAGALATSLASAQTVIHAHPDGSFDPTGKADEPFATLRSAVAAASETPGATIRLAAGTYHEYEPWLPLRKPMTLRAEGGPATIGDMGPRATTLDVQTYNTHLFGGLPPLLEDILVTLGLIDDPFTWQEMQRAIRIGSTLTSSDVIGLQEVWSDGLWPVLRSASRRAHWFYGNGRGEGLEIFPFGDVPDQLHSGLAILSHLPLSGSVQWVYAAETGILESLSAKSFIRTEISKGGVPVGIFMTHLQAGPETDSDVWAVRSAQLARLAADITLYRATNPGSPVIIMGDLNIAGTAWPHMEYKKSLENRFAKLGFIDAAREDYHNRKRNAITVSSTNVLRRYFDSEATNDDRLDYILYAPSFDGSARLVLRQLSTILYAGDTALSEGGLTTRHLSDHYAVRAEFDLLRR